MLSPNPPEDRLRQYYEPDAPRVPDGSAEIPLHWGGLLAVLGGLAMLIMGAVLVARCLFGSKRR